MTRKFTFVRLSAVGAVLATLVAAVVIANNGSSAAATETLTCEELPQPWTAAHEVLYDPDARTVVFVWDDNTHAAVKDTEPGCDGQPGLEQELQGNRDGAVVTEQAACRELQALVDAVRSERRAQGQSTRGRAPVSDAAQAAAARRIGAPAEPAVAKRRSLPDRAIDLDQADATLGACPR